MKCRLRFVTPAADDDYGDYHDDHGEVLLATADQPLADLKIWSEGEYDIEVSLRFNNAIFCMHLYLHSNFQCQGNICTRETEQGWHLAKKLARK